MTYRIARNGQTYGPYTVPDVRRYLASGHIQPTDLAQQVGASEWLPVHQLFPTLPAVPAVPPPAYPGGVAALFPDPPDLPWWVALILEIVTGGLFFEVWHIVQSAWLRRVDRTSVALYIYVVAVVIFILNFPSMWHSTLHFFTGEDTVVYPFAKTLGIGSFIIRLAARFIMRSELCRHFNAVERIGLRLSAVMTFFFGGLYFQYHFNRINETKRALGISVPAA